MSDWDVVVVGGGAAGVAAARRLADAGKQVLIVEAADRLGGRAHTVNVGGVPIDLGCGWLHSAERNPWVKVAEAAGFTVDRSLPQWRTQWHDLGFSPAEREAAGEAFEAFDARMRKNPPLSDRAADALDPGCEWNAYLDALSGFINGAGLDRLSIADYLAYDDAASETDWRVREGYGTLVAAHARELPVALGTPVTAVDLTGSRVRIETPRGALAASAAIVTVSTHVLASGAIRFTPALDDHLHAAASLPLGDADKLFLAADGIEALDANAHLLGNPRGTITGTYTLCPMGRPVIECMLGGEGAREMARRGLDGAAAFAIEELAALLGGDWRKRLRLVAGSCWSRQDHVLGAYSHALPGCASARKTLAAAPDPRLQFAGEACHPTDFSTAHGAYETGLGAAEGQLAWI